MKLIETKQAVGHVICHDITIIVKDKIKDTAFRKGHIVKEEDIPVLLSIGKDHLYVWEKDETMYHEDEAAVILADACEGKGMKRSNPKEGKIELTADCDGLFQVDVARLTAINSLEHMMIATRHTNTAVKKGDKLAGLVVDSFIGQQEVVLKSLGAYLTNTYAISGATILGDGEVALIIDGNALIK